MRLACRASRGRVISGSRALFASIATLALLLGTTITHSFASSTPHACAPFIPPPVAGSPIAPPSTPGIVLFNEILTNPGSTWNCAEQGTYSVMSDSWVELYNPQNQPFNLYAARAYIDAGPSSYRYYLPFGAEIAPHGFLVLFPNTTAGTMVAGNNLQLMFLSTTIDQVSIPPLATDDSYARIPDGSSTWQITTTPTIDSSNIETAGTQTTPVATSPTGQGPGPGGTSGTGNGGNPQGTSTSTAGFATGTQPAWSTLNLPPTTTIPNPTLVSPTVTSTSAGQPITQVAPTSSSSDVPRRITLTALLLALAGALYWWWKVHSS